ncbi:MAG: hypothetical protein LBH55_00710 [Mycoplasmataceae bacterium]|jgi:multisubunit Na+/H+ antiporter MnhE subunit|nr:hypothetical protein [Mycoplasmataceae bacterium]
MKINFLTNTDKYSIREIVCNYFLLFGWLIGIIIAIIVGLFSKDYITSIVTGKIVNQPNWMQPLFDVSFIFIFSSIFASFLKIKYKIKRRKGTLISKNKKERSIV